MNVRKHNALSFQDQSTLFQIILFTRFLVKNVSQFYYNSSGSKCNGFEAVSCSGCEFTLAEFVEYPTFCSWKWNRARNKKEVENLFLLLQ